MDTQIPSKPLSELIGQKIRVKVVDIGANPIDGRPPYAGMLEAGEACVVGFEPNPAALAALNQSKSDTEVYLPYAVGNGERQTLHICAAPGMTSLLCPDEKILGLFHGFPTWGQVLQTDSMDTVRLADIPECDGADLIKIDIQGGELQVFEHAGAVLDSASVVHSEVEFLPLYQNQPLFSEVETFLRKRGFMFHRFSPIVSRVVKPLSVGGDIYAGFSQMVWADAIFIRDLRKLTSLSDEKLLRMCAILHDCYQSFDIVMHALSVFDDRRGTTLGMKYLEGLKASVALNQQRAA